METYTWQDYEFSRLTLGTAQLGMAYGVANTAGQPDLQQAVRLIAAASEGGVNCFDTAAAYGESEVVLGRALHELRLAESVVVVTKVRALTEAELAEPTLAALAIEHSVSESRRRLGLGCLPVVLFHRELDAVHIDVLEDLKGRGWLRYAGVSCDHQPGPAIRLLDTNSVAAVQLPGSILDRRHQRGGVFSNAVAHGAAVFIRSVYLQGLLLMPEESIPASLRAVVPLRHGLAALASASGMTLPELALRYMLSQAGVASVVVGAETAQQASENAFWASRGPLSADLVDAVDAAVVDLPDPVITPRLWKSCA